MRGKDLIIKTHLTYSIWGNKSRFTYSYLYIVICRNDLKKWKGFSVKPDHGTHSFLSDLVYSMSILVNTRNSISVRRNLKNSKGVLVRSS